MVCVETEGLWFTAVAHVVSVSWAVLVACVCMDKNNVSNKYPALGLWQRLLGLSDDRVC